MAIKTNTTFKTIGFSQGEQFLKLQKNKIQNNSYINNGLTRVNGYDESGSYIGQATLRSTSSKSMVKNQTVIEGFSGMYDTDNKPVSDVNSDELQDVKRLTRQYNTKLKAYQEAYTKYIDDSGTFTKSMPGSKGISKKYAGQNVILLTAQGKNYDGYITNDGFFKYYEGGAGKPRAMEYKLESDLTAAQKAVTDASNALAKITSNTDTDSDSSSSNPSLPTTPGCNILLPKGCPKRKKFTRDGQVWTPKTNEWQLDRPWATNRDATGDCDNRPADFNRWCGTTGAQSHFVSSEDTSTTDNSSAENAAQLKLNNAIKKLQEVEQEIKDFGCPIDRGTTIKTNINGPISNINKAGTKINTNPPIYTSTPMTSSYKCDNNDNNDYKTTMDATLSSDKQSLDDAYSDLMNIKKQIDTKISSLNSSNSAVADMLEDEISQFENDTSEYENIQKNVETEKLRSMDVRGMYEDSDLNAVSRNTQFLVWSILAIGIVSISIFKTR